MIALQAGLQRRVLLALVERPAESVSALARQLDVTRPTVSRATGSLLGRGLVQREGRRILITPGGEAAIRGHLLTRATRSADKSMPRGTVAQLAMQAANGAHRYGGTLASMPNPFGGMLETLGVVEIAEAASEAASRRAAQTASLSAQLTKPFVSDAANAALAHIAEQSMAGIAVAANSALRHITEQATAGVRVADLYSQVSPGFSVGELFESLQIPDLAAGFASTAELLKSFQIPDFAAGLASTAEVLKSADLERMTGAFGAAVASAVQAQEMQLRTVSIGANLGGWWAPGVAQIMPTNARMLSDLTAMQTIVEGSNAAARRLAAPLGAAMAGLVNANTDHFAAAILALPTLPPVRTSRALDGMVIPSSGSASFVHGARHLFDSEADSGESEPGLTTAQIVDLLRRLDSNGILADALLGAWDRVASGGPDWSRSAAHQAREALNLTLEQLSSGAPPDPRLGRPTRKTRVRFVLGGGTLAIWAEAQAGAFEATYTLLSAEAHTRFERRLGRPGMAALLRSVEALLIVLLTANRSGDEDGEA
jgi:DNA-binding transcriptional ArsR family regulator